MKLPIAHCPLPIVPPPRRRCGSFRTAPAARRCRTGFTLIEVMVALAIFSMVIAAIYATWNLVMRATVVGQGAANQAQRQRVVLRSIGDALMGIQSFQASQQYYWFKLQNGDEPFLSFVARLPDTYARNGKFVGAAGGHDASTRRVTFSLASGQFGEKDLVLRQNLILLDMDQDEQQFPLVLAKNVKDFSIEWWGTNNLNEVGWSKDWDDTQTNTIPQMVRIHLVLGASADGGNNNNKYNDGSDYVATRIYTVPSQMMPAMVQRGIGGPPGMQNIQNGLLNGLQRGPGTRQPK